MRDAAQRTFRLLRGKLKQFPDEVCEELQTVLVVEQEILDGFRRIVGRKIGGARIRCHGDYHLGQVLFTGKDFVIIDFEGEPSRKISERRIKRSPLRDVAGMIRSFDYASQSILLNQLSGIVQKDELPTFQRWAQFWSLWTSVRFLQTYLQTVGDSTFIPQSRDEVQLLLDVFLLEKAVYELDYELNNRPSWVRVPVQGILRTLEWNPP
jgi:maltose alpha-D-glucosyltransferase/alpha-amylase